MMLRDDEHERPAGKSSRATATRTAPWCSSESKHASELLKKPGFERYARAKDTVMFDPAEIGWTKTRALVAESQRLVVAHSKTKKTKTTKKR